MKKGKKTLKNLLLSIAGTAALLSSCKKDEIEPPRDLTPPKITIYSPGKDQTFDSKTITLDYLIEEENPKTAWYSINEGEKISIPQSGHQEIVLPGNGNYTLFVGAKDRYGNSSKDSTYFEVKEDVVIEPEPKDTIPPKINTSLEEKIYENNTINFSGNIEEENFSNASYTINGGDAIEIPQFWSTNLNLENGDYKIIVNAKDKEGNSSSDTTDFSVNKQTWKYLANPFVAPNDSTKTPVWNGLKDEKERNSYLDDKLYNHDETNKLETIPGEFVCTDFASLLENNFHGHGELGFDSEKGLENNGLHNIPMYTVTLMKPTNYHQINGVVVGDKISNINNLRFIEPTNDSTYTPDQFRDMGVDKIIVNYTRVTDDKKSVEEVPMLKFIPDGNKGWKDSGYRNEDIKLIETKE